MEAEKIVLRNYRPEDCVYLAELFYETVHTVNAGDYSKEQLDAWADGNVDLEKWNLTLSEHLSVVAVLGNVVVGFADMDRSGYLDRLYVHRDYQRRGIGAALCDRLESSVPVSEFITHASITARPFFEARGYRLVREQKVERKGILLTNYVMRKKDWIYEK